MTTAVADHHVERMSGSLKFRHVAVVTLRPFTTFPFTAFPVDMLRYDRAYPDKEEDSAKITATLAEYPRDEEIRIRIVAYSETKKSPFTVGRWKSFGVEIEPASFY